MFKFDIVFTKKKKLRLVLLLFSLFRYVFFYKHNVRLLINRFRHLNFSHMMFVNIYQSSYFWCFECLGLLLYLLWYIFFLHYGIFFSYTNNFSKKYVRRNKNFYYNKVYYFYVILKNKLYKISRFFNYHIRFDFVKKSYHNLETFDMLGLITRISQFMHKDYQNLFGLNIYYYYICGDSTDSDNIIKTLRPIGFFVNLFIKLFIYKFDNVYYIIKRLCADAFCYYYLVLHMFSVLYSDFQMSSPLEVGLFREVYIEDYMKYCLCLLSLHYIIHDFYIKDINFCRFFVYYLKFKYL